MGLLVLVLLFDYTVARFEYQTRIKHTHTPLAVYLDCAARLWKEPKTLARTTAHFYCLISLHTLQPAYCTISSLPQ